MPRTRRSSISTVLSLDNTSRHSDDTHDDHIITIDLNSAKLAQNLIARQSTTSDFQEALREDYEELRITASVASDIPDKTTRYSVRIVTTSPNEQGRQAESEVMQYWLHLTTECLSFQTFRKAALNFALRHNIDAITVLIYLLQRVEDDFETTSAYGSYIKPGTVLRCDGKDRKHPKTSNVSATFISFPYFDVSDGSWPDPPDDDSLHLSRGLFQQHYPREFAQDRDRQQSFAKFKQAGKTSRHSLRVPQLWVLILGSTTLITCGPSTLASTFHDSIEFVTQETLLLGSTSLVQVSADFVKKAVFYLPLESCQTFLALKVMIQTDCLQHTEYHIDDCVLHTSDDNVELDASRWPNVVQKRKSVFISVRISLRDATKLLTNESLGPQDESLETIKDDASKERINMEDEATPDLQDRSKPPTREEIASAAKAREKEFQDLLEREYRERLMAFGFTPSQIDAMIDPENAKNREPPANPSSDARRIPTYPKVHRDHLDVRTLMYYDIMYQNDMDTNYILILRELNNYECRVLFEHTRRLRQKEAPSKPEAGIADCEQKGSGLGSQKHDPSSQDPDIRSGSACSDRSQTRTKANRAAVDGSESILSAPYQEAQEVVLTQSYQLIDSELRVPPFLAWPTTRDHERSGVGTQPHNQVASRMDFGGVQVQITLRIIDKRIYQVYQGLKADFHAASLVLWQKGKQQTTIPAKSIPRNKITDLDLKFDSNTLPNSSARLKDMIQYPKIDSEGIVEQQPLPPTSLLEDVSFRHKNPRRRVLLWQIARMFVLRNAFVNGVKALVSQFVPKYYEHPLIDRCWGSVSIIDQTILKSSKELYRHQAKDSISRSSSTYIVRHLPKDGYIEMHLLDDLNVSISSCDSCNSKHRYNSVEDAINHLRSTHVSAQGTNSEQSVELLRHWITSTTDAEMESSTERLIKLLETLTRRVNKLLSRSIEMRQSVANGSQELDEGYLLRSTLVTAAEKLFQFLYFSAHSFSNLREKGTVLAGPELLASSPDHCNDESGAEVFATLAELAMSRARDDLLLMTQTGDNGRSMSHFKASPQFTIYLGLLDLVKRPLMWDLPVMELYRDYLSALRFEASRKPSKRVLRELYLLDEEIEVIESVYMQQYKAEQVLCKVLSTDEIRLVFKDREESIEDMFSQFRKDLDRATKALRHNIEILEEGNSKAILIFTLVTIIFLPLSFIASVFGMNTTDIRDMNSSQRLFWSIALPVTAAIGAISLVAAYGHDAIVNGVHKLKDDMVMKRAALRDQQFLRNRDEHSMDEERADGPNKIATELRKRRLNSGRSDPWLSSKRWSSRRYNSGTRKNDSTGKPILVRTGTGRGVYEDSTRRSCTPDYQPTES